jgi:hypothetical protein
VGINTSLLANPGVITLGVNPCPASANCSFVPATTSVTVGVHHSNSVTLTNDLTAAPVLKTVLVETTTPTVNSIAVSREGTSADLSKVYATTTTNTTYYCYDENVSPTDCANTDPWVAGTPISVLPPAAPFLVAGCTDSGFNASTGLYGMSCPNLYNGTAVVTAAAVGTTPINTYVTTIPAPSVVTYCNTGNPETGEYDGQKNCPAMTPLLVLGRS